LGKLHVGSLFSGIDLGLQQRGLIMNDKAIASGELSYDELQEAALWLYRQTIFLRENITGLNSDIDTIQDIGQENYNIARDEIELWKERYYDLLAKHDG